MSNLEQVFESVSAAEARAVVGGIVVVCFEFLAAPMLTSAAGSASYGPRGIEPNPSPMPMPVR